MYGAKNQSPSEKIIQHEQYKKTRNKVNSMIRADVIKYNEERIEKANDTNEVWKVVFIRMNILHTVMNWHSNKQTINKRIENEKIIS